MVKRVALVVAALAIVSALTAWPRMNDVETGRTPEYPDLQVRTYSSGVEAVSKAARAVIAERPRWIWVAAGTGPRGAEVQAIHETRVFRFQDHVSVRIFSEGGRTRVSVRSRSATGLWDFGQNARNIREFLEALDRKAS